MAGQTTTSSSIVLIAAVLLLICILRVDAFQFDLKARDYVCFREEIVTTFDVYGEYEVGAGYSQKIDFKVTDPRGNIVLERKNIKKGDLSFVAKEGGEYSFCFYNRMSSKATYHDGMRRRITFDILTGTDTFDYEQLARKEHLKPIEVNLRMMEDIVHSIYAEYVYFREREGAMRYTTETINQRITYMGIFFFIFMAGFAFGQIYYLRSYFIKKKLI
ncbi:predicted protein [Naegleria gruberi]|uniref:Predicted protein n=1 Tax=Naegleria gruberi TaxID=5762 RepID=D2V257_NAEGR|nr:uncharacterized protein NAEGRDRAFT_30458 [Naegleria gruberi]EFC48995.1 predicted protein [Naegleria gruberi]|eukprot:XP_002681739.1 predicted protein [Naegleria gruberi strain NEG-M]